MLSYSTNMGSVGVLYRTLILAIDLRVYRENPVTFRRFKSLAHWVCFWLNLQASQQTAL